MAFEDKFRPPSPFSRFGCSRVSAETRSSWGRGSIALQTQSSVDSMDCMQYDNMSPREIANMLLEDDSHRDPVAALKWYERAAEDDDDDEAMISAANLLLTIGEGDVIIQNERAAMWLQKASDKGNGRAAGMLGLLYLKGRGVPKDNKMCVKWHEAAAKKSDKEGLYRLGLFLYTASLGLEKDIDRAQKYFAKSAEKGYTKAAYMYGISLQQLEPEHALTWFLRAANDNHTQAIFEVGKAYVLGMGTKVDKQVAHRWFLMGSNQGCENCKLELGRIKKNYRFGAFLCF